MFNSKTDFLFFELGTENKTTDKRSIKMNRNTFQSKEDYNRIKVTMPPEANFKIDVTDDNLLARL